MSCAHPFNVINKNYGQSQYVYSRKKYFSVPCGYCLNCRIDRRNYLEDMSIIEKNNYDFGAFVTFTFDTPHLMINNIVNDENTLRPTLRRKDVSNLVKNIRSYIEYHKLNNNSSIRLDFKYIASGEYGDKDTNRCHYHFIFFGLDYILCKPIFENCWKNGNVKILPIQDGGIRYVLKYLDKIEKGKQLEEKYTKHSIEKPFICHSTKLGHKYILENLEFIKAHNYNYLGRKNTLRPLSSYLMNKFKFRRATTIHQTKKQLRNCKVKTDLKNNNYSFKLMNQFKHEQALIRESNLRKKIEKDSKTVIPQFIYTFSDMPNIDYDKLLKGYSRHFDGKTYFYDYNDDIIEIVPF